MTDMVERLRVLADEEYGSLENDVWCYEELREAADEIASLRAALSLEREAREKAEKDAHHWEANYRGLLTVAEKAECERGAAIARARTAEADADLWQIQAEGKRALEASLAEARAEIERMTPRFVAYEYLESPERADRAESSLTEAKRLLTDADAENARLLAVIKKAQHDIDMARFGEGYGFNLPFVVYALREALRPSQTAVSEDWQQNNEHGGYPIVVQLPGNAITRLWRRLAARFLAQEPNHER